MSIPTIAEAASLIAAKKLSPVELTKACLARLHATENTIHAFVLPTEERALAEARTAEAAIMKNGPSGPMHGIPIGLKDIVDTAGLPTTCQSRILQDNVPDRDAACAAALKGCGHGADGQVDDSRICRWRPFLRLAETSRAKSMEPRSFHSRIQ